jgi:inorganic phosphate transporter, PiT family
VTLLIVAIVLGFYVAWNIGANDVANAMGTSVGSGALTLKQAVILAAIFELAGAFLLGSHVADTVESGIVNPSFFLGEPRLLAYGMMAALLAAGVWLQTASYFGWPVSTTHSIVGALAGFGIVVAGIHSIYWGRALFILGSWLVSPLLGGAIAFSIFNIIRRRIFYARRPIAAARRITPYLVFTVFAVLAMVLLFHGMESVDISFTFWPAFGLSIAIGIVAALISMFFTRRIRDVPPPKERPDYQVTSGLERALRHLRRAEGAAHGDLQEAVETVRKKTEELRATTAAPRHFELLEDESRTVERIFVYLQIISACFMAFAHGSNDVANAIGPLSAVIEFLRTGMINSHTPVPFWLLAIGGVGIVIGLATWGWRVIKTVGKRITELTPTRGFSAEFGAAITILVASRLGLPVSTTHTLVGAVLGVGIARGISAINLNVIRDIVISWIVTIPAGALLAILFYHCIFWIFG